MYAHVTRIKSTIFNIWYNVPTYMYLVHYHECYLRQVAEMNGLLEIQQPRKEMSVCIQIIVTLFPAPSLPLSPAICFPYNHPLPLCTHHISTCYESSVLRCALK